MKVVKFLKPSSPYAEGDIAGIDNEEAAALIKAGVAKAYGKNADADEAPNDKNVGEPPENKMVGEPDEKK